MLEAYEKPYQILLELSRKIMVVRNTYPMNAERQKTLFLSGKNKEPEFRYVRTDYDPAEAEKILKTMEIPGENEKVAKIYFDKINEMLIENWIVQNKANLNAVKEGSIKLYGKPSNDLVSKARKILEEVPKTKPKLTATAEDVKSSLEQTLTHHGLYDWKIVLSEKKSTTVYASEKRIEVCRGRQFDERDPSRLAVHEIGIHVLRAANGFKQPLKLLGLGLAGFLETEEGLTSYSEERTGNLRENTIRNYASLAIAVDSVVKGMTFRETFDHLRSLGLGEKKSWNMTMRAHRGGGFIKDHVYLEGFYKVKDFAKNNDLKPLFVGKIGIEDLPVVKDLMKENLIKPPKHIPLFM